MTKQEAERLAREAKHSFAVFVGFLGAGDSKALGLFLKYPDALDAYVSGDLLKFRQDMATLIVQPIKYVTDALVDQTNSRGIAIEIEEAMTMAQLSPISTKLNVIRLGNMMVAKLNVKGKVMIPIGAYLGDPESPDWRL